MGHRFGAASEDLTQCQLVSRAVGGDWARVLVTLRHARLRHVHSCGCRSANFHLLLQDVESVYKIDHTTTPASAGVVHAPSEHDDLHPQGSRSPTDAETTPVEPPTPASIISSPTATATPLIPNPAYSLAQFWAASLVDSCASITSERGVKSHHYNVPLQCMLPRDRWLFATSAAPCAGVIHGVDIVNVVASPTSDKVKTNMFARLSLLLSVPGGVVLDDKEYIRSHQRGSVTLHPPPTEISAVVAIQKYSDAGPVIDAAACYSKRLRVRVSFDPELSDIPPSSCDVFYYVANCSMASLAQESMDRRDARISVKPPSGQSAVGPINASDDVSIDLALPGGTQHCAFVLWVQLKHEGRLLHSTRVVYALHADGTLVNDLCVDTDEAEFVAGNANDDVDGGGANKQVLNSGNSTAASRWKRSETYHGLIDVFFPMSTDAQAGSATRGQQAAWCLRWAHALMYRDVSVHFLNSCIVNGCSGYIARVTDDGQPSQMSVFVESIVSAECRDSFIAPRMLVPLDVAAEQPTATLSPPNKEIYGSSSLLIAADGSTTRALYAKALGDPTILLASFAVAPVQLFASHPKHHRNIIPEAAKGNAKGNAHINAAFMRLRFDRLPNIFRTNLDRLPLQLRDEYLKESLPNDISFLGHERPLASLLAALFTLHPRNLSTTEASRRCSAAFVHNSKLNITSFRSSGVLYSRSQSVDESSGTVIGSVASRIVMFTAKKSFCEVLTDPTSQVTFPSLSVPQRVAADIVAAVATEVASRSDATGWSLAKLLPDASLDRPMGMGGLSVQRDAPPLVPWLYRPVAGVAVVGGQLLHKRQQCRVPEAAETPPREDCAEVMFQYVNMRSGGSAKSATSLYRLSSYGQLSRDLIFKHQQAQFRTGRFLVDYFTLLLRRRQRDTNVSSCEDQGDAAAAARRLQFPDGIFKAFGNAHEPLYLLYMGRRALRNLASVSFQWTSSSESGQRPDETTETAGDAAEVVMFETLLRLAERILRDIHLACGGGTSFLNIETAFSNESNSSGVTQPQQQAKDVVSHALCTIKGYSVEGASHLQPDEAPVDDGHCGDDGLAGEDGEREAEEAEQRTFEMVGNVYGRLPSVQVKVWWVGGEELCLYELIKLR
jgi:hypothetical protein